MNSCVYWRFFERYIYYGGDRRVYLRSQDQRSHIEHLNIVKMGKKRGIVTHITFGTRREIFYVRNPIIILLVRWLKNLNTLLNATSDKIDPDIISGLPQGPVAESIGVESTETEVEGALKSMASMRKQRDRIDSSRSCSSWGFATMEP